ncbi:hypothetical protein FSP39_006724 [Pinctada imbricata]|uniref:PKD domain-containing protein n=1 Tax=Pinctada imbricata TaxID=66713 RepID=A0AA88XZJ1_PINIB|nr:hypothetical protein FSP39_006724 [Pinctada imbricata]
MEDINTNVVLPLLLVLLTFYVDTSCGKVFSRELYRRDSNVLEFKEIDKNHDFIQRFRRETSANHSDQFSHSVVTGNLTSTTFLIPDKTHTQAVVHWTGQDSKVLFVLTREQSDQGFIVSSTLWRSSDYGTTFTKVNLDSKATPVMIYKSPVNRRQLIITDLGNKRLYISEDEGVTWIFSSITFQPDSLLLHPTDKNYVLAYSIYEMVLMISTDFGRNWKVLRLEVSPRFYWAVPGVDENVYTVHMEITDFLASSEYVACIAPNCTEVKQEQNIGVIDPYTLIVQNEYIFVQKTSGTTPDLYVSHNRGPFRRAYFPMNVHPRDYLVVDTNENQVFVAVDHQENVVNLYLSDTTGQFYVTSLTNVVSIVEPGWFDVDFYEVSGISGTYIANQYTDPDAKGNLYERTYISYDKGGTWQLLKPPENLKSTCKDPKECHLNLHLVYSNTYFRIPGVVTKKEAPGLILAHGVVGETLYDGMITNVFTSRDGGISWNQAPFKGYYHLNILDQGSAVTAILQNNPDNMTNAVLFSCDEGASWQNYTFSSQKMYVDGVLTEPGINTLVVSVFGRLSQISGRQMVKLDFGSVLTSRCEDADYEEWSPTPRECVLGQTVKYERKKPDSICYNGRNYTRPIVTKTCQCTSEDFECDYGYEMTDMSNRVCTKADWYDVSLIKLNCKDGEPYNVSQGYRKIASDKCVGGADDVVKYRPMTTTCPVVAPQGLKLRAPKEAFAVNDQIRFTLSQEKGSIYVTTYTWNMGDGTTQHKFTGLKNSSVIYHRYNTSGTYNISVYAENDAGKMWCFVIIRIEDKLSALEVYIPFGSQLGKMTWFNVTLLGKKGSSGFGLVHYVWKFGDQPIIQNPLLTWDANTPHVYNKTGKFNVSVEAVNSVSSTKQEFTLTVYPRLITVQLRFTKNFDSFNQDSFLWRSASAHLLAIDIAKLLYIPSSRLIVTIPPGLPTVADITILPPKTRGLSMQQVLGEIQDKVKAQELIFSLLSDDDIIRVVSVHTFGGSDVGPNVHSPTTPSIIPAHNSANGSLPVKTTVEKKISKNNLPVMIAVPAVIVVLVLSSIVYFVYRRKSRRRDQRYSLIMNRGRQDQTVLDDDDFDDDDFLEGGDDFESEDGNTNIVINPGLNPTLVMMTNTHSNNDLESAIC